MQFGIRSAVLNSELPQNSRIHILEVRKHSKQFILQLDNGLYLLMLSAGFSVRITFHKILTTFICQQEFNAGLFDYLIATDDSKIKENEDNEKKNIEPRNSKKHAKPEADSEFGVVRGIDFKNVHTVCHFYSCCYGVVYHTFKFGDCSSFWDIIYAS